MSSSSSTFSDSSAVRYHLGELEIARNPGSVHYAMPEFAANDRSILDIGCGIGQTFLAANLGRDKLLVGLDIDLECLVYGRRNADHITFIHGTAEHLPFRDGLFDLVISRVSLPYTDIPRSLQETRRVLGKNGRVWFTLHPLSMVGKDFMRAIGQLDVKDIVYRFYVLTNGILFHYFGRQFSLIQKRYESFQTPSGMTRAMERAGFTDVWVGTRGRHLVCTGRKVS
jgi:ubiquinone/menaquinone biosynthesis C-methylase UbiE